ncbi:MAG: Rpn family recombination-promoting nuclease/putative transposase [Holosporaceae bacterium]|jgi:hypothetical protein|nr:Rpn family recombination-promoting nuclease/putative transposase [Holosporaceae bacterium]
MISMNGHKNFSLKFYLVLFLGLVPFLNASHLSERGPSIFAKATTDIAFKKMLSDTQVAEALINAFFQSMPEGTISLPIKIKERGEENVPIGGLPGTGSMDFHAITNDDNHIVIEMQAVHHDYFDRRALFYAASTFVKQILPKEDLPEEESTGSRNMRKWYARLKDVYAIQFIDNYRSPSQDFKKYYKMTDVFSQQMLNGIHLIQIELKKIQHIQFPLSDSQASSLQPVDW